MTIADWLRAAQERLEHTHCPDPAIDARWIAEDVLHMNRSELHFEALNALSREQLDVLNADLERRAQGEPVQYILNRADFMGLKFYVDERVLIPRQDTESLVEAVIIDLQSRKKPRMLDLCCGSGAIGLSVKSLLSHVDVTLSDISTGALEVARKNAHALGADVTVRHGDLFNAVGRDQFDLIASNPPYIPSGELAGLQREVQYEPAIALDGGSDGLNIYRRIASEAGAHLKSGGSIYLEVGAGEAHDVLSLMTAHIEAEASGILKDLTGVERIVWIRSK